MKFTFYGHACFLIDTGKEKLLFDPFLTGNGSAAISADEVECDYILLSHAHGDHLGDAAPIAKRTGAAVIAVPEVLGLVSDAAAKTFPLNLGGGTTLPFGRVTMVPALHSSGVPGGVACGFLIQFTDGVNVYYSGDTALFSDMALIGKKAPIHYAVLPIGDDYTMGPEDAVEAARLTGAKRVIPIHYNTWPIIAQDPEKFAALAEEAGVAAHVLAPGESLELKK